MMFKQSLFSLAAALSFSLMAAFVKYCAVEHSPQEMVFYRSLFGVLCVWLLTTKPGYTLKTQYPWRHFVRSFLGVVCMFVWFYSIGELPFGTCMTLSYTSPIFLAVVYVYWAMIAHRPAPWMLVFSILAGFMGIVLVMKPNLDVLLLPAMICLSTAIFEVPIKLQMKAMGLLKEPSYRIVFYFCLLGTLFALGGTLMTTGFHVGDTKDTVCMTAMVLFGTAGQYFLTRSYAYGNVLLSACLGFSAIPFSAFIGWAAFDETTDPLSILGMTIIILVGIVATAHTRSEEMKYHGSVPADSEDRGS